MIGSGEASDPIDDWLSTKGAARRIVVTVPNYLQALQIAAATDLVAFAPGRMIAALAGGLGLTACEGPLDPGEDQQYLFYPARAVRDPGSIWLRELIKAVSGEMPTVA